MANDRTTEAQILANSQAARKDMRNQARVNGKDDGNPPSASGLGNWLETQIATESSYRTPGEFNAAAQERKAKLEEKLPSDWRSVRDWMRGHFKVSPQGTAVIYGEQAAGLNEPTLVTGKRLLAQVMRVQYGWEPVEYFADSDVLGSEPGLHSMTIPNPYISPGIESATTISVRKFQESPANQVKATEFDLQRVAKLLRQPYTGSNRRANEMIGFLFGKQLEPDMTIAQMQDALFRHMQQEMGLHTRRAPHSDLEADTAIARNGGLDLILNHWDDMLAITDEEVQRIGLVGVRVPTSKEAPFYAYPKLRVSDESDERRGIVDPDTGAPMRARIWMDDDRQNFRATHPYDGNKVLGEFTKDDILDGKVGVTFRAIPRAFLFATGFDGHITGGGSKYNLAVAPAYQRLLGVPFYPIAHMDNAHPGNDNQAVFQYDSEALKKEKAVAREKAANHVNRGTVSSVDLFVSMEPPAARQTIKDTVENPNFTMATRVDMKQEKGTPKVVIPAAKI